MVLQERYSKSNKTGIIKVCYTYQEGGLEFPKDGYNSHKAGLEIPLFLQRYSKLMYINKLHDNHPDFQFLPGNSLGA
jgi:hypothetical protein